MAKKLVGGGVLQGVIDDSPNVINEMMNVNQKLIPVYPKIAMQAVFVNDQGKNLQHFMLESIVEACDSYVYASYRYIMDINGEESLDYHFNEFYTDFCKRCNEIKEKYEG